MPVPWDKVGCVSFDPHAAWGGETVVYNNKEILLTCYNIPGLTEFEFEYSLR